MPSAARGSRPGATASSRRIAHRTGGDLAHLTYAVAMRGAGGAPKNMLKAGERSYVADKPLSEEAAKAKGVTY